MPTFSIILRSKNEERWIGKCLQRVLAQHAKDVEVILVDNLSTDATVQKARSILPNIIVKTVDKYHPGKALNLGIEASSGEFIVCLSAHCIPESRHWLSALHANFADPTVAGVYGRQKPTTFSDDTDKRDLWLLFGKDKRVQSNDYFFHNANSMLRRSMWKLFPFDPDLTNIEDRAWGKQVIEAGYKLVYEPEAAVYHHHGVHQNGNAERCRNVVRIMEHINADDTPDGGSYPFTPDQLEIAAFIPLRQADSWWGGAFKPLIRRTVIHALENEVVNRVFVSTDSDAIARFCGSLGAETSFDRPPELANARADAVHQFILSSLNKQGYYPDLVIPLEVTYPFRPKKLLGQLTRMLLQCGYDSAIAGYSELRPLWTQAGRSFRRIDDHNTPRDERNPFFVGLHSVGCVTHADVLRRDSRMGTNTGILELDDPLCSIEIRTPERYAAFKDILDRWEPILPQEEIA